MLISFTARPEKDFAIALSLPRFSWGKVLLFNKEFKATVLDLVISTTYIYSGLHSLRYSYAPYIKPSVSGRSLRRSIGFKTYS